MVTQTRSRRSALFAALDATGRERLSRVAADVRLVPGEYAAPAGADRALFAVLEGRIEAVRVADGIEQIVGERLPGDVFGEVPIALGTVFPVGFRAAEASRVMRSTSTTTTRSRPPCPTSPRRSGAWRPTAWAARAGCRAWPPSRRRRARS